MIITEFENIAKDIGATLNIKEDRINVEGGASSPNVVFLLTVNYKNRLIRIKNATGTYFSGTISCQVSDPNESLKFAITTRSHFSNLFTRKKDRFKIKTENENIKSLFRQSAGLAKIRVIAEETVFEPTIIGRNSSEKFELITEYHLQFTNWWEVIKPIVLFNKEFIDRFG